MTDRELLELAAKAAGYQLGPSGQYIVEDGIATGWNPLEDDGDALRLALDIGIAILPGCRAQLGYPLGPIFREGPLHPYATHRAIVCAAAEVGRKMK